MDKFLLSRLTSSIRHAVRRMNLDLRDLMVVTECATGAYSCTPAIAALAGAARVVAFGKDSSYGTFEAAREDVFYLWKALGLPLDVLLTTDSLDVLNDNLRKADIVTNSGHLRPLDKAKLKFMRSKSAIPVMYEAWELRNEDIDLNYCREKGILVGGTNERHPDVDVFEYLGPIVAKAILNSHHEIVNERCLIVSNNDMGPYINQTLKAIGAEVVMSPDGKDMPNEDWDIIVIASTPPSAGGKVVCIDGMRADLYCQLWGDVNRKSAPGNWCPIEEPHTGHMGLTLPYLGSAPVVKLQAAGLKCGEAMLKKNILSHNNIVQWLVNPSL